MAGPNNFITQNGLLMGRETKLFSFLYFAKMPAAVVVFALCTSALTPVAGAQAVSSQPIVSEVDSTEMPEELPTDAGTNMPMLPDGAVPVEQPPYPADPVIVDPSDVMPMSEALPADSGDGKPDEQEDEGADAAEDQSEPAAPSSAADAKDSPKADNALPDFELPLEKSADGSSDGSAFSLPGEDDLFDTSGDSGNSAAFAFDKSPEEIEADTRKQAFDAALQGLLPLRPAEIRELLEHFDRTQQSVSLPVYPNPKPETVVQTVSLDPGAKPLTVYLAYGNITTINFVDATGEPWPVENITWAGNIEVGEPKPVNSDDLSYSNILRVSPVSEFAYGNMSITMTGLRTPIIMTLETNRDVVHYRFDAIIPEDGPLAKVPIIGNNNSAGSGISAGDEDLTAVLEGVTPAGAEKLAVSGVDGRTSAYRFNGFTYVRTPLTLLSPGWSASMASADGMNAYAMEDAPVLILSDNGRMVRAKLSDREDDIGDLADE